MRALLEQYQLLLAPLIFVPFEQLFAARPQKIFRRGLSTDMAFLFLNGWLVFIGVTAIIALATLVNQSILPSAVKQAVSDLPYWAQALIAIVIGDLGIYWTHRILHVVPAMWRIHAVHHAVEELDWLAAIHQHPLDVTFMKVGSLFPLFALGFSAEAIGTYLAIYYWQSWLAHANVRLGYGRATPCPGVAGVSSLAPQQRAGSQGQELRRAVLVLRCAIRQPLSSGRAEADGIRRRSSNAHEVPGAFGLSIFRLGLDAQARRSVGHQAPGWRGGCARHGNAAGAPGRLIL
ncbi:sterol desaturase family protein [Bradyrhizobium elkanii]|uniref:sterol desaturase family protein n=1 Tax=Bradyrhizobium elkanii TaxID=29448 RepID=UPI0035129114